MEQVRTTQTRVRSIRAVSPIIIVFEYIQERIYNRSPYRGTLGSGLKVTLENRAGSRLVWIAAWNSSAISVQQQFALL